MGKRIKRLVQILAVAIVLLVFYLLIVPSRIDAVAWQPDPVPPLDGPYEANDRLNAMEKIFAGGCHGCEDVAIDSVGAVYTGEENGSVVRFVDGQKEVLFNTDGRPLGMDFNEAGELIIADAIRGLLIWDRDKQLRVLTKEHNGIPFGFTDDVEVGSDGNYYFSDASSKYGFDETILDLLEHGGHGRLLVYRPKDGSTELLLDGLQFANGVAVAEDASFVLVNETGLYCVNKYWLKGPGRGEVEKIMPNLPGYPDNISRGFDGIFWLTLIAPRDTGIERLSPHAWLRNLITKLPPSISEPKPVYYGMVLGIDSSGHVIYNFQDASPNVIMITSVQQYGDTLYMGSLEDDGIGRMSL